MPDTDENVFTLTVEHRLAIVQQKMKVPKNRVNTYGGFNYRNASDIYDFAKPLLFEQGLVLRIQDDIKIVGDRVYIVATAIVCDIKNPEKLITHTALAREAVSKKAMDDAQVSGTTSSYARKYCLDGLFLLDDTPDPDSNAYQRMTGGNQKAGQNQSGRGRGNGGPEIRNNTPNQPENSQLSPMGAYENMEQFIEHFRWCCGSIQELKPLRNCFAQFKAFAARNAGGEEIKAKLNSELKTAFDMRVEQLGANNG